jgi:hydrogenase nickel incorporation protein HypB
MCQNCGCSTNVGQVEIHTHSHDHDHNHHHHHDHDHTHNHNHTEHRSIEITQSILAKNTRLAERNRGYFLAKEVQVINVLSSPGSGKTAWIQKTITDLKNEVKIGVIVGDLETDNDAQRLRNSGATAIQITTGSVCHLEAEMVAKAAQKLNLDELDLLIIENVGNLVCPADYDLGENFRVVLFSVTEGEDKPLKYPTMFKTADLVIINKIDLAEAVEFDRNKAVMNIQKVSPQAKIFEVSAKTGSGMREWYNYLKQYLVNQQQETESQVLELV